MLPFDASIPAPGPRTPDPDAPVLVAVLPRVEDLARARAGWYRIPLDAPARRLAADYLAFYQTGAFPPDERWAVQYYGAVRGYHIATRRELIPEEPGHPNAAARYYRVDLGPLLPLPRPIPSRRLRRITFIHTTLDRLLRAREINDLWLKTPAQQRLLDLLEQARIEAEFEQPLVDDDGEMDLDRLPPPAPAADFAITCREGRIAVVLTGDTGRPNTGAVSEPGRLDYLLARGNWRSIAVAADELARDSAAILSALISLAAQLGGPSPVPRRDSPR